MRRDARPRPDLCADCGIRLDEDEPEPGCYDFDWLDRSVAILGNAGLRVVLGTPTATPPKWLVDRYPDILLVDQEGRRRRHGGRRHADLASASYWQESKRIVTTMAERYVENPHVAGWQVDNEFGCHDTTLSYSDAARDAFRRWLKKRYGGIEALNEAWGNVFWSMTYRSFDEIEVPNLVVAEAAPAHQLDFRRSASAQVAAYGAMQAEVLRRHSPGRFVTHNFMNFFFEFDPFVVSEAYDFASWDSYPLGQTDMQPIDEEDKRTFARVGHPDVVSFGSDTYRGAGRGRFWIMEQQPGAVNWAARQSRAASRRGQAVDVAGARARRRGRLLFPLASGAVCAGADACRGTAPTTCSTAAARRRARWRRSWPGSTSAR